MGITGLPLKLMQSLLKNRLQRVVLNGQTSAWTPVLTGVLPGSISGPLFFSKYINDFAKDMSTAVQLFADVISIFSAVNDTADQMNKDLEKTSIWAYHWKMPFKPFISKQVQEIIL